MSKQVTISLDQAIEIYKRNPEFRNNLLKDFSDSELGIKPIYTKKWEELKTGGDIYYINEYAKIATTPFLIKEQYRDSLPTKEKAESVLAYCQLSMVYAQYPKGEFSPIHYMDIRTQRDIYRIKVFYPHLDPKGRVSLCGEEVLSDVKYKANYEFVFSNEDYCQEFIDNNRELLLTWFKGR